MTNDLKDILIVADMDNTLLTAEEGIPTCNLAAIELFCLLGGHFTVASGRSLESISKYTDKLKVNVPIICYGGAMIYDFKSETIIESKTINKKHAMRAAKDVLAKFPYIGMEIMSSNGKIYVVNSSKYTYLHTLHEQISYICADINDVAGDWLKVLFAGEPNLMAKVKDYCETLSYYDLCFIATNDVYFEIMPRNVTKATALQTLYALTQKRKENCVVIGDYFNDIPMFKSAGYSVAMQNSPQDVKICANEITANCLEGGVGQFIYKLIKQCEKES